MRISRIGYSHSFQVSQFQYDKIYLEAELEPGDTEEQVIQVLIEKCKGVAAKVQGQGFHVMNMQTGEVSTSQTPFTTLVTIQKEEPKPLPLEDEIKNAKDLTMLETFGFLVKTEKNPAMKPYLLDLYEKRKKELQKQPT